MSASDKDHQPIITIPKDIWKLIVDLCTPKETWVVIEERDNFSNVIACVSSFDKGVDFLWDYCHEYHTIDYIWGYCHRSPTYPITEDVAYDGSIFPITLSKNNCKRFSKQEFNLMIKTKMKQEGGIKLMHKEDDEYDLPIYKVLELPQSIIR